MKQMDLSSLIEALAFYTSHYTRLLSQGAPADKCRPFKEKIDLLILEIKSRSQENRHKITR